MRTTWMGCTAAEMVVKVTMSLNRIVAVSNFSAEKSITEVSAILRHEHHTTLCVLSVSVALSPAHNEHQPSPVSRHCTARQTHSHRPAVHIHVSQSVSQSICLSVCVCVCLSVCLSVSRTQTDRPRPCAHPSAGLRPGEAASGAAAGLSSPSPSPAPAPCASTPPSSRPASYCAKGRESSVVSLWFSVGFVEESFLWGSNHRGKTFRLVQRKAFPQQRKMARPNHLF